MFGPKRNRKGEWRRNFAFCNIFVTFRAVNCRRFRKTGYVARMDKVRSAFKMLTGKPTGNRSQEGLGVDGRTVLEWILNK